MSNSKGVELNLAIAAAPEGGAIFFSKPVVNSKDTNSQGLKILLDKSLLAEWWKIPKFSRQRQS